MKIDLRLMIPFLTPLVMVAFARFTFLISGVAWGQGVGFGTAVFALIFGGGGGAMASITLFMERKEIGHIRLWGRD